MWQAGPVKRMDIFEQADRHGIETGFFDAFGQWRTADEELLRTVIGVMDVLGETGDGSAPLAPLEPVQAFDGAFGRVWVIAIQLYSLRSAMNWGIGDFGDLRRLVEIAGAVGAAGIGLNPLHVLFADQAEDCSPYSPSSRLFLNTLYIDLSALPELPEAFVRDNAAKIDAARAAPLVDYPGVARLKAHALQAAFAQFKAAAAPERRAAFESFRRNEGRTLSRFAAFEILRREHGGPWWLWPVEWREPDDGRIAELRAGPLGDAMAAVEFAQWCASEQLDACARRAAELQMPVGLYLDLAVGVKADGFDAWNDQKIISRLLSVGAPPDVLNTVGQNWGLAGFMPVGFRHAGFEAFRAMLRASMRYAGAIRLDHVLGLKRLYLIPHGFTPDRGVYVRMPLEHLLAAAAEESLAQRCVVIGEDLGTVPEGFRDDLARWGLWSYRVMMFERDHYGDFLDAACYPPKTLVTFATHDLASYEGWRRGLDLDVKEGIGLNPGETREGRREAVVRLEAALRRQSIGRVDFAGVVAFLSRTPSRILAIMIEDVLGLTDQVNIPGTITEHPNWRRKLPLTLEELRQAKNIEALLVALEERRNHRRG